jgi:hypothetical protein
MWLMLYLVVVIRDPKLVTENVVEHQVLLHTIRSLDHAINLLNE